MAPTFRHNEVFITGKATDDRKVVSLEVATHAHDNNLLDDMVVTVVIKGVAACYEH